MDLPQASQTCFREGFLGCFFPPFNERQHSPAMLTRMWVHTLEGSMRAQSLLHGVSRMELPAPSTPWSCSPVHPAQPPLQRHPQTKLHTHRDAQGTRTLEQSQQANQTHNKHTPEKWLTHPSLFCASSWRKLNGEQPEGSAVHLELHISTII